MATYVLHALNTHSCAHIRGHRREDQPTPFHSLLMPPRIRIKVSYSDTSPQSGSLQCHGGKRPPIVEIDGVLQDAFFGSNIARTLVSAIHTHTSMTFARAALTDSAHHDSSLHP